MNEQQIRKLAQELYIGNGKRLVLIVNGAVYTFASMHEFKAAKALWLGKVHVAFIVRSFISAQY
jgi:hypothetical protein